MKRKTSKADLSRMTDKHPADTQADENQVFVPWSTDAIDSEELDELQELTMPPMVKIADMPIGACLDVTIISVMPSRNPKIETPVFIARLTKGGNKISIPAVAAIANVLLPGYDKKEDRDTPEDKCPYIGKRAVIRKAGIRLSKQFEDDSGKPRKFPVFDVFVK